MASSTSRTKRSRGNVTFLLSGSARVTVYAGIDQLTGKPMQLRETVPARSTLFVRPSGKPSEYGRGCSTRSTSAVALAPRQR